MRRRVGWRRALTTASRLRSASSAASAALSARHGSQRRRRRLGAGRRTDGSRWSPLSLRRCRRRPSDPSGGAARTTCSFQDGCEIIGPVRPVGSAEVGRRPSSRLPGEAVAEGPASQLIRMMRDEFPATGPVGARYLSRAAPESLESAGDGADRRCNLRRSITTVRQPEGMC